MTAIMFLIAMANRTPVIMWLFAMVCDTAMAITYMIMHAKGLL